jgi:pimeloyl-ACP methyl ester carboxylesterase
MKLADHGFFWVGAEHKKLSYGTIVSGQMYVQYLIPAQVRHPIPVVLVHGGGGQMLHYMGTGDGAAGWAHYYVQEGYRVYLVDRPGHGRAPYHPDALGPIGPQATYAAVIGELKRAAGPNRQWPGAGDITDPLIDQFMASQNAAPQDQALARELWASRGAALLEKIGPAIVQTHSAGGPFGWLAADRRPTLVKAIVCVEGAAMPFESLTNLKGIPIVYVTAEKSGRTQGQTIVASLTGRLRRRGTAAEGSRRPRQQPLHGAREQPPAGVRRHPRLDRAEVPADLIRLCLDTCDGLIS